MNGGVSAVAAPPAAAPADRFLRARERSFVGLGVGEHGGRDSFKPFHFVQMADTQLGMEESFDKKVKGWDKELQLMRLAAAEVNRLRPAFCIVCGDLVDEWPEEEQGRRGSVDAARRELQEADFKAAMSLIDEEIPLICLCGNHDIGNRPNAQTIKRYESSFGDDYLTFWCHGIKCLVVNSQLWKDDSDAKVLRERMDAWLDKELGEDGDGCTSPRRMLVFSHVPPFINKPDEANGYFNLELGFRQRLLAKMAAKGVVAWFCGHYHRNAGGVYRDADGRELEVVVSGAVGVQITDDPVGNPLELSGIGGHCIGEAASGLRIVRVLADSVEHEWKTFSALRAERSEPEAHSPKRPRL